MNVIIPSEYLQEIRLQAEADYPNETCGILLSPKNQKDQLSAIFPCRNVQDEYHAQDPVSFPRTARTAYFIDPKDLLKIQRAARETNTEMRVIYHSHVEAGAYFSDEDQRIAISEGRPAYPGVTYLVVSVCEKKVQETALFDWDDQSKSYKKI